MQNEPGWSFDDTHARCRGWTTPGGCFDFIYNRQARASWARFVHGLYPGGEEALKAAWPDFGNNATDSWDHPALPEHGHTAGGAPVSPADIKRRDDHALHTTNMLGQWVGNVSSAIRNKCVDMPITVGALSLGTAMAKAWAPHLSYYSVHLYPKPEWNTTALIAENYRHAWAQLPNDSRPGRCRYL